MAFVASARALRPQQWADVLGQDVTVRILQNAIKTGRIANAYIFSGQKGCGKTTIARLIAKSLNCQDLQKQRAAGAMPEPCGVCASCVAIADSADPDVTELDAASHRGIDDVRALQRIAQQQPREGAWRVVILDEAHQLTKEAQSALLALFESPPSNLLHILCTTDADKILPTIASRCASFRIRPLAYHVIAESLRRLFDAERQPIASSALHALARAGNGSLRDVQQLADQLILCAGGELIDDAFLEQQAGVPTVQLFSEVANALSDTWRNGYQDWIEEVDLLYQDGVDLRMVFFQVIPTLLRDIRVAIVSRGAPQAIVPYQSGISHEVFQARNRFSDSDVESIWQSWDKHAAYFGQLSERTSLELFLIEAWDQCCRSQSR